MYSSFRASKYRNGDAVEVVVQWPVIDTGDPKQAYFLSWATASAREQRFTRLRFRPLFASFAPLPLQSPSVTYNDRPSVVAGPLLLPPGQIRQYSHPVLLDGIPNRSALCCSASVTESDKNAAEGTDLKTKWLHMDFCQHSFILHICISGCTHGGYHISLNAQNQFYLKKNTLWSLFSAFLSLSNTSWNISLNSKFFGSTEVQQIHWVTPVSMTSSLSVSGLQAAGLTLSLEPGPEVH